MTTAAAQAANTLIAMTDSNTNVYRLAIVTPVDLRSKTEQRLEIRLS
jgi:hypothetical protein